MPLTKAQLKKYGLSKSDASASNYDRGIVKGPDGLYYSINGFERQQKKGLDTDQGDVFSSSLYEDAKKKGFSVSNFNTATDVEGALQELAGRNKRDKKDKGPAPITVLSPRLATSRAFVDQYEEDMRSGQFTRDLFEPETSAAQAFYERYKERLGSPLESGNYAAPEQPTNPSKVASGKNDISVDAASVAKTGRDEDTFYFGDFGEDS